MLKTRRRRWLLAGALFFLTAVGIAIAQVVTAQGEEASGVRHIVRTNASGELIVAASAAPTEVEGTIAEGSPAAAQHPVTVGGEDGAGNLQRVLTDTGGRVQTLAQGTTANAAAFADNPVVVGGRDGGGDARLLFVATDGQLPLGWAVPGADGVANASQGLLRNSAGTTLFLGTFDYIFNGTTWDRKFACTESAPITLAVAAYTEIIAAAAGETIRICHVSLSSDAAMDLTIYEGTGLDCAVGTAPLTGVYEDVNALALDFGSEAALRGSASQAVCLHLVAAANAGGVIIYAQF